MSYSFIWVHYWDPFVDCLFNFEFFSPCPGQKKGWCFICEFERLILNAKDGSYPVSPIGILSKIQKIGSHLGHGREEDAHEFLRWKQDYFYICFCSLHFESLQVWLTALLCKMAGVLLIQCNLFVLRSLGLKAKLQKKQL